MLAQSNYAGAIPSRAPQLADDTLAGIDEALARMFRIGRQPRISERLGARAGVRIDRAASPALGAIARLGPVRLSDLASALGLDLSTVSRHVQSLQDAGLVERTADQVDRRACAIALTASGRAALEQLRQATRDALREALAEWSPSDLATLEPLLGRLAADLVRYWAETA